MNLCSGLTITKTNCKNNCSKKKGDNLKYCWKHQNQAHIEFTDDIFKFAYEYFNDYYDPITGAVKFNQIVDIKDFQEAYEFIKSEHRKNFPESNFAFESDERSNTINYILEKYPIKYKIVD